MITRRDIRVAAVVFGATLAAVALAQSAAKPVMHSRVFQWSDLKVEPTQVGERRGVFDAPTANLTRFECHITTLNPGEAPHAPHRHGHEELMIIREGTVEAVQILPQLLARGCGAGRICGRQFLHSLQKSAALGLGILLAGWRLL